MSDHNVVLRSGPFSGGGTPEHECVYIVKDLQRNRAGYVRVRRDEVLGKALLTVASRFHDEHFPDCRFYVPDDKDGPTLSIPEDRIEWDDDQFFDERNRRRVNIEATP